MRLNNVIGREPEKQVLNTIYSSKGAELVAVFGRRHADNLYNKMVVFTKITRTKKQTFMTMVSANGVRNNKYYSKLIDGVVVLDDRTLPASWCNA